MCRFLGPGYGERPNDLSRITEYISDRDAPIIELINRIPNCRILWNEGNKISMCGLGAAMLTTDIARNLGRKEGKLLKYAVGSQICDRGLLDQTGFASFTFI